MAIKSAIDVTGVRLSHRERKFISVYEGDPVTAAEKAGYSRGSIGHTLMKKPTVLEALKRRDELMKFMPYPTDPVLKLHELRQWWTDKILNDDNRLSHRVKCSELLAKSYGAFVEKFIVENYETKDQTITIKLAGPENNFLKDRRRKAIDVTPKVIDENHTTPVD